MSSIIRDPDKEVVLITGASSGIGLATARALLEAGYGVIAVSRHCDESLATHPDLQFIAMDLSEIDRLPARLTELVDGLEQPVRALINNAGIGRIGNLEQLSYDDLRVTMDVNFLSHAMITKALLPGLKKRGRGDIIFMGSESALAGARQGSLYCASKFALRGFAQSLREECGKAGVRVCLINPGATRSNFFDDLHYQPGAGEEHAILPDDVARVILEVLSSRAQTVFDEINLSPLSEVWERKR